jgi:hypothetical protein
LIDALTIKRVENGINGDPAQDFNITADSYVLVKGTDGKYKDTVTLTAHLININGTLQWYK